MFICFLVQLSRTNIETAFQTRNWFLQLSFLVKKSFGLHDVLRRTERTTIILNIYIYIYLHIYYIYIYIYITGLLTYILVTIRIASHRPLLSRMLKYIFNWITSYMSGLPKYLLWVLSVTTSGVVAFVHNIQGLYSLSGQTSYHKNSWSLEAAKFGFRLFQPFWTLTSTSAAPLPRCLLNFRPMRSF